MKEYHEGFRDGGHPHPLRRIACAFCRTPICETSWRAFLAGGPPPDDDKWFRVHHDCADPMKSVLRLLYSSVAEDILHGWVEP